MMTPGKTSTSVHDETALRTQRGAALAKDQCALAAMEGYAQIFLGMAMYLYQYVATPAYFSLFLMIPYLILLILWARMLAKRATSPGGLLSLAGRTGEKCLSFLLFLAAMLDALMVFYGLCAMTGAVMTDLPPAAGPVAVTLLTALSLIRQRNHALSRLARFLRWIIGGMLLYCAFVALPHGRADHFFPLLGGGVMSIGRGALWLCGAVSVCCAPLFAANLESSLTPLLQKKSTVVFPALRSLGFGILTLLVGVWLLPYHAMTRPYSLGWKLLLVTNMTPDIAAWSLEFLGLTLLFLLTLCASLSRAAVLLARASGRKSAPPELAGLLALLLLPAGLIQSPGFLRTLVILAPLRGAAVILVLMMLTIKRWLFPFHPAAGKEASP